MKPDKTEEWLKEELNKLFIPPAADLQVQWWIDNDKLPSKELETVKRDGSGKFVKGMVYMRDLTWSKENPYKKCYRCNENKHITEYRPRKSRSRKLGWLAIHSECLACENPDAKTERTFTINYKGYGPERGRKAKALIMEYFGGTCHRCEGQFQPVQIDMDHKDPTKKKFLLSSKYLGLSDGKLTVDDIVEEVKNIQPLCSNCHRLVSTKYKHHLKETCWYHPMEDAILYRMTSAEPDRDTLRSDS